MCITFACVCVCVSVAKYLTSSRLLSLQLRDPTFRRHLLLQLVILFQYLINPTGEQAVASQLVAPTPTGTGGAAPTPSSTTSSSASSSTLTPAQLSTLKQLSARVVKLLKLSPPQGERF